MEVLVRAFTVPIGRKEGPAAIGLSCGFCCAFWLYDRYAHESSVPDSDSPCAWYVCVYIYTYVHTHTHFQPALHDIVAGLVAKVGGLRAGCLLGLSRSEICRALGLRV